MFGKSSISWVILFSCILLGCGELHRVEDDIDSAVSELSRGVDSFEQAVDVLEGLKGKLDKGDYKNQVENLIRTTGQVGQLSIEGSLDFTRTRIIEDLENMKRSIRGQEPLPRKPVLASTDNVRVDFDDEARSTVTIVGWNLDVAAKDHRQYTVTVHNAQSEPRSIPFDFIGYQGQYAVTVNLSKNGFPLQYFDSKIVFDGYDKEFSIVVVDSSVPPMHQVSISGTLYAFDYETFPFPHEEGTKPISASFTLRRGESKESARLINLAVGGEVWATVDMSLACDQEGKVTARFYLNLYEGTKAPNNDLDGHAELVVEVPRGGNKQDSKQAKNDYEAPHMDYMELKVTISNNEVPASAVTSR